MPRLAARDAKSAAELIIGQRAGRAVGNRGSVTVTFAVRAAVRRVLHAEYSGNGPNIGCVAFLPANLP
jgi:hypothetical protein